MPDIRKIQLEIQVSSTDEKLCSQKCPGLGNLSYCHYTGLFLVRQGGYALRDAKCFAAEVAPTPAPAAEASP